MMKSISLVIIIALIFSLAACGSLPATAEPEEIHIGVSIWSTTDALGSQCKRILDAAGEALGVKITYVEQMHISEQVTASVETLAAAGCDGIIVCNAAAEEMSSVIKTADENEVYIAQFFRVINQKTNPIEFELACESPYYVGSVHENEVANGANLARILLEKGNRKIALLGWERGDATFLLRWEGYKKGVEDWNEQHPDDMAVLLEPEYGGTLSETGKAATESIIAAYPDIDSVIVSGGGGDVLTGAIDAIGEHGLTGKVAVVSTDFIADLGEQLRTGAITAESGGHFCDPLFAFMMVYHASKGEYEVPHNDYYEILFPYIYVASAEDYEGYEKYFVENLPYTSDELKAMGTMSFQELSDTAAKLSVHDAAARRGK